MNNIVYLSLGSNIGDRAEYLHKAVQLLNRHEEISVQKISSIYETKPVGYTNQDYFLNIALRISTSLTPNKLLAYTQHIENELGRIREIHWGPRTIDLDILLYNNENIEAESLIIPHPRMNERAFVLAPLYEIHQELQKHFSPEQIEEMKRQEGVRVWKQKNGEDVFALFES